MGITVASLLLNNGNAWGCVYLLVNELFMMYIMVLVTLAYISDNKKSLWYTVALCGIVSWQFVNVCDALYTSIINITLYSASALELEQTISKAHEVYKVFFRSVFSAVFVAVFFGTLCLINTKKNV